MKRLIAFAVCVCVVFMLSSCTKIDEIRKKQADLKSSSEATVSQTLEEANKLRRDYDLGTLKELEGDIAVAVFFISDFESNWDGVSTYNYVVNEIQPGLTFLENQAKRYGVSLNFEVVDTFKCEYSGEVLTDVVDGYATVNILDCAAIELGYESDNELYDELSQKHGRDVICMVVFNKNGESYGINPPRGNELVDDTVEHSVLYSHDLNSDHTEKTGSQAPLAVTTILYLYGAENLDATDQRENLALEAGYYRDLMLNTLYDVNAHEISEATAFYIGWTDEAPEAFYKDGWVQAEDEQQEQEQE